MAPYKEGERRPSAGEHRGGGESVAANHLPVLYHRVNISRARATRLVVNLDALCTLVAGLWCDAERLSRRHIDADHLTLAIDADLAARLAHRLQAHLAEALEGRVAA